VIDEDRRVVEAEVSIGGSSLTAEVNISEFDTDVLIEDLHDRFQGYEAWFRALRDRHEALISSILLAKEAILAFNHVRAKEILDEAIKQDSPFGDRGIRS
jgi:hypothetical protein